MDPIRDHALHLVLNVERYPVREAVAFMRDVSAAGVTVIHLCCMRSSTREFLACAAATLDALHIPVVITDRVDVALGVAAAGVHLGRDDLPISIASRLRGVGHAIGAPICDRSDTSVDPRGTYVGIGPVFPTRTKETRRLRWDWLQSFRSRSVGRYPVSRSAGSRATPAAVMQYGVDGIAVVSAICESASPARAAAELVSIVRQAQKRR